MSTIQLESLLQYILSLRLSKERRQWLADKIVENAPVKKSSPKAKTEYERAWEDVEKGQVSEPFSTSEELFGHLGI